MARRASRPVGPRGLLARAVVLCLLCAACAAVAVIERGDAVKSSYVQAHGVRDSATVVSVLNTIHRSKHSSTTTAEVTVHLQQPVSGTSDSVVHVPYRDDSSPGDTIAVLVDPRQPGYSELPGSPDAATWTWIVWLCISAAFLALAVLQTRKAARLSRQRQAAGYPGYPGGPPARF